MTSTTTFRSLVLAAAVVAAGSVALAGWNEGLAAFDAKKYPVAAEHFAEVIRTNPSWSGGYYMLGRCRAAQEQGAEAILNLRKAFDIKSSDPNIIIALSRALMKEEEFSETRKLLEMADSGAMPPALRSEASTLLAEALLGDGDAQGAVDLLQERLGEDETNPSLYRTLGKAQTAAGDRESAFRSISNAFKLDPEESSGLAATGAAFALAGAATDTEQKTQWYRQALDIGAKLATSFPKVEHDLMAGQAALGAEDLKAAERWFRAAVSKDGTDPEPRYFLGWSLTALGRTDDAYHAFSTALANAPDDALTRKIHGRMGPIAACRLDLKAAAAHYRSARQEDRAQQIESLVTQFAEALAQLEKLRATVRKIQQMERELEELGDVQGVTAMRERAAAERTKITEIEHNLEAVRSALCP